MLEAIYSNKIDRVSIIHNFVDNCDLRYTLSCNTQLIRTNMGKGRFIALYFSFIILSLILMQERYTRTCPVTVVGKFRLVITYYENTKNNKII